MRLIEERKTHIVGVLLVWVLICQLIQSFAGGKQQSAYNRINWLVGHSNKALTLLSNLSSVVILDEENRSKNVENYRNGLTETYKQHIQMSKEERELLSGINLWSWIEQVVGLIGLGLVIVVMKLYLELIRDVSERIKSE